MNSSSIEGEEEKYKIREKGEEREGGRKRKEESYERVENKVARYATRV